MQWTLEKAKGLLYTSRAACRSLEEFCSLLTDKLQWLAKLQDPWRSGFLFGARIFPLHLLNPFTNLDVYVDTLLTAYFVAWFETVRPLFAACTAVYFGFECQHCPLKRKFLLPERLSMVYCTHIVKKKLMLNNREIFSKNRILQLQEDPQMCLVWCWGTL
jgi:hypothetical protein